MRTLRGARAGAIALLIAASSLLNAAPAAAATPPTAPYTALTMSFESGLYSGGNFSYERSRNTLDGSLPGGLRFEPIVPERITDTRKGQGWPSASARRTRSTCTTTAARATSS